MLSRNTDEIFDSYFNAQTNTSDEQKQTIAFHKRHIINLGLFNLGLTGKSTLTEPEQERFLAEIKNIVYFAGNEISLFENEEFSITPKNATEEEQLKIDVENFLKFLLIGTHFRLSSLNKPAIVNTIFKEQSPAVMKALRAGIHSIFDNMDLAQLNKLDENGNRQFEIQLTNILALYPFTDPQHENSITFPQKINGEWQRVTFNITPIELAPDKQLYPDRYALYADENGNVLDERYRSYAYGLKSVEESANIHPYLLFMGTPPETGQGHQFAVLTDFTPNHSIGEEMYKSNRDAIVSWAREASNNGANKIRVTGESLGGALSLYVALDIPHLVHRVDALNAPGLYENTLQDDLFSTWDKMADNDKPIVMVHLQQYDIVQQVGYWKKDWQLIKMFPKQHEMLLSGYLAHIRSFANHPGSISLVVNTVAENSNYYRWAVTKAKSWLDTPIQFFASYRIKRNNAAIKTAKERPTP